MGRIRTHNNRRRAKALKAGGIWTLGRVQVYPTWGERGASPEEIRADLEAGIEQMRKAARYGW